MDDGRGTHLPGATEGTGAVQGLRGRDGGRIIGRAHDVTEWASGRGNMDLEKLGLRGTAADVLHVLPSMGGPRSCPVEGFPGRAATRTAMRVHFMHRHVLDTVVILEDGNTTHPWCPRCDMLLL